MDINKEIIHILAKGQARSTVDEAIVWAGDDAEKFKCLVNIIMNNKDQNMRNRASWVLSYIACEHPELLKKHWKDFVYILIQKNTASPVIRNVIRFMQEVEIPKKHQGIIINRSFELVNDPQQDIAIRAFALTVIANHLKIYPEIAGELKLSIEELLPYASAGLKNRASKILQKIYELNK